MSFFIKISTFFTPLLFAFIAYQCQFLVPFIPQIIAFASLIIILSLIYFRQILLPVVIFVLNLAIFSTGGISSPIFFLSYFLLFSLSFQNQPTINLVFSLITMAFYSYSLNSINSIIQLFSVLLISPLTYFISRQQELQKNTEDIISQDETDFLFWISLHLKKSLNEILFLSENPKINKIVKNLLKNSEKLSRSIDEKSDEI
ncbi:hypothetical protein KKD37_00830 [Patescibacteria group bacterium]|nr:hypothetical protein [Patescibacteria group bacterium]